MKRILTLIYLIISLSSMGQNNCPSTAICNTFSAIPNGFGVQELNASNRGCISLNENNSTWVNININSSGTLTFTINPIVNADDFDFAVWGPNPTCPPTTNPIRCSWAIKNNNLVGNADNGNTGISTALNLSHPQSESDLSEGAGGNQWVNDINVLAGQAYLIMIDNFAANNGFTITFGGTSTINCAPLAVELMDFKVNSYECNKNVLTWATASETNNNYFNVERSVDGIVWLTIGTQVGAGNSSTILTYNYIDSNPEASVNYYRLKQFDYNGNYMLSEIISIDNSCITSLKIDKVVNLLGQEVKKDYGGPRFIYYNNGTITKKMGI